MSSGKHRVLAVDDDPLLTKLVETTLARGGFEVQCCGSAEEATRLIAGASFDVVLLDLGLPDVSGFEVLAHLRTTTPAKTIILTADATPESVIRAFRDSAYQYLRKPIDPRTLLAVVKDAVNAGPEPAIEVLSSKPDWVEVTAPCTRRAAERLGNFIRTLVADLPAQTQADVSDAFRELLMNAVEWGGELDPGRRVRISCLRTPRMLQYRIADPGAGFRLEDMEHAATQNPPDDPLQHDRVRAEKNLRPGGLGLLMVRSFADELLYNEAMNEVVFIKYLDGTAFAGAG